MKAKQSEPSACFRDPAFTLIEIVVALTIVAVVAAVAIPTVKGLEQDEKIRAPIKTLGEVVQQVRERAMRERKAYQIVFEHEGIHATAAMYPYEKREEYLEHLEELEAPPPKEIIARVEVQRQEVDGRPQADTAGTAEEEPRKKERPWTVTIPLKDGMECEVLMWGDGDWDRIEGEKMRRWVFQPSGMANPARVRLHTGGLLLETAFDVLTGEMTAEKNRTAPEPQL
jgi:prepilin-type N-terminal cleavage/methylation domain-containing protein